MTVSKNQVINIISMGTLAICLTTDPKDDGSNETSPHLQQKLTKWKATAFLGVLISL